MSESTVFSIETDKLLPTIKNIFQELKNGNKKTLLAVGLGMSFCIYMLYQNTKSSKKESEINPSQEKIEINEAPHEENKEEKITSSLKSNNPSVINTSTKNPRNIDVKSSLLKSSLRSSKVCEEDSVHRLPSRNNPAQRMKDKHIFKDYTSFEEDAECDSLSTKEEKSIYHKRRVASYSTDNEFERRNRPIRSKILSMAKEANPSDQLFFKLCANLAKEN